MNRIITGRFVTVLKRPETFITGALSADRKIRIGVKPIRITVRDFQPYIFAFEKKESIRNLVLVDMAVGICVFFLPSFYNRIDILL